MYTLDTLWDPIHSNIGVALEINILVIANRHSLIWTEIWFLEKSSIAEKGLNIVLRLAIFQVKSKLWLIGLLMAPGQAVDISTAVYVCTVFKLGRFDSTFSFYK